MRILLLFTLFLSFFFGEINAESLKYNYSYIPKVVFQNQIFPITILAKDGNASDKPTFIFEVREGKGGNRISPIFKKPLVEMAKGAIFYTFYFKAKGDSLELPDILIKHSSGSNILNGVDINVSRLDVPERINFSGVIASKLKIKTPQVSKYNSNNSIVYLTLEGQEANLEDMNIPNLKASKIEKIHRFKSTTIAKYMFLIPSNISRVKFTYFNTIKQRFIPVSIDTEYKFKNVAAQVNLNPKDSSFTKLKKYTFALLSLFFIAMFLIYKDYFYLALFAVTIITLLRFFAPLNEVCIKKGAKIYILPIANSTVGKTAEKRGEYPLYHRYKNYSKIEYENGVIGWVKDEDLCKN